MNNANHNINGRPQGTTLLPAGSPLASASASFFLGAPITKLLCLFWLVGYLLVVRNNHSHTHGPKYAAGGGSYNLTPQPHFRNVMSDPLALSSVLFFQATRWFFSTAFELVAGTAFLAQYLRRLEREISSRRLVAWLVCVSGFYAFTQVLVLLTLAEEAASAYVLDTPVRGPYALIGGVLYWYAMYVPRLYPRFVSLLSTSSLASVSNSTNDNDEAGGNSNGSGIALSEKAFAFAWAFYLLCQKGSLGILVGVVGMVACAAFFSVLPPSLMDVPETVANALPWDSLASLFFLETTSKIYAPLLVLPNGGVGGRRQAGRQRDQGGGARRAGQHAATAAAAAAAAAAQAPTALPPSQEAIGKLTAMGFDEDRVKEALLVTSNNVERAADILLTG